MKLNLTNLRDLEFICEAAASAFRETKLMPEWEMRAERYGSLFRQELSAELEKKQKETEHE